MCGSVKGCPFPAGRPCADPEHRDDATAADRQRERFRQRVERGLPDAFAAMVTGTPGKGRPVTVVHLIAAAPIRRVKAGNGGHGRNYNRSPGELIGGCRDDRHGTTVPTTPVPGRQVTCNRCLAMALAHGITWPAVTGDHWHSTR